MNIDIKDLAVRAFHTFWQAFVAVLAVTWAAAGIDVSQIVDVDSAKKIGVAALSAVAAAALSAIKTTIKTLAANAPGVLDSPDPEPEDAHQPETVNADAEPHLVARLSGAEHAPEHAAPPAPPAQA